MATEAMKNVVVFELLYHPDIPGRGEYVRLVFEMTGTPYKDIGNIDASNNSPVPEAAAERQSHFAPPILVRYGRGKHGCDLKISQTPNILLYLGRELDFAGSGEEDPYVVNELALTALDLCNEVHDTHHPIAIGKYYEDQKDAALEKSKQFREERLPKFFSHFQGTLQRNKKEGRLRYLVGKGLTYADTTLWQTLDGLMYAFPRELEARQKEFPVLFDVFYQGLKEDERLSKYLTSDRRKPYGQGIYRHYPELDRQ